MPGPRGTIPGATLSRSGGAETRSVCRGASIEGPWTLRGDTDRDATARMKDLHGSGVPLPFECIYEDTYGKREYQCGLLPAIIQTM